MNTKPLYFLAYLGVFCALIFAPGIQGCDTGPAEMPSYIRIDTIPLDSTSRDSVGSFSHRIRFAWVYIDDNLQGVYQLPVAFPVLLSGTHKVEIFGGVNENGFSTQASRYPYYSTWKSNINLVPGDTLLLSPSVKYRHGLYISNKDNFDQNIFKSIQKRFGGGSFDYILNPSLAYEGQGYGYFYLPEGDEELIVETDPLFLPSGAVGYFLELNYRNNCDFIVGVRASGTNYSSVVLGVRARSEWNKIYINLTNTIDILSAHSQGFNIFFRVPQDTTVFEQEIFIDNFKVVY